MGNTQVKSEKKPKFYGWIMVFAGFLITSSATGLYSNCMSVFIKPVTESLGFARAEFSLYSTIMMMANMVLMPIYSEVLKKPKILKKIMLACACVSGTAIFCYSFATKLWHFYIMAFFVGTAMGGVSFIAVGSIINNWFHKSRGLATGLAFAGSGISAAIMVPILTQVVENSGWQMGYRVISIAGFLILFPTLLFLVKITPEEMGQIPYGDDDNDLEQVASRNIGLTRTQVFKLPDFAVFILGTMSISVCVSMMLQHTLPFLTDIGYDPTYASTVTSAIMTMMTVGKIFLGTIYDRFGTLVGSVISGGTLFVAAVLLLLAGTNPAVPYLYAIIFGIGYASGSITGNYLCGAYFGNKDFSRIYAMITLISGIGSSFGNPISAKIFDVTGSYNLAWMISAVFGIICLVCLTIMHFRSKKLKEMWS